MHLNKLTGTEYIKKILKREISVEEVLIETFHQIESVDRKLKAFLVLNRDEAILAAKEIDSQLKRNKKIPLLAGMPIAVKDIICTKGVETTCASNILRGFVPPYDATVIQKIKEAGGIIIGKTNMDEFGMGSSNENSAFQTTLNPWNTEYVPGGSSGGSAVAVAANETMIALGTDTGGSVRLPASFCGVVGIKPTYGRISRYGVIAYASSLDQVGVLSKCILDAALMMNVICGYDPRDSTSACYPVEDFTKACYEGIEDLHFGVPKEFFREGLNKEVKEKVLKAIHEIEKMGGKIKEISLPRIQYALPAYYLIGMAEASSNLAKFDGVHYGQRANNYDNLDQMYRKTRTEGFGEEVIRRIMLGTYALSSGYYDAYYLKAQKVRTLIKEDFETVFKTCDIILCPTSPVPAFKIGEKTKDPLTMYLTDIYTLPVNLAGLPGLSMNCGYSKANHLPIGIQMIGRAFEEEKLLRAAYNYELLMENRNKERICPSIDC